MSEAYAGKPVDKHPSSAPKKEYPDAFSGIGAEYSKAALNFPTELERLRENLARMFEELPETTWTSKDVAYAIRNFTTRAAMGESDG